MGIRRLNKHIYYVKHHTGFILIEVVPLHVCYMLWPFFGPSQGMSIQKSCKGRYDKIIYTLRDPLFTVTLILILKYKT